MGRRKTKKSKAGGGKHPSPGSQGSGSEGSPALGIGDPGSVVTEGACAARSQPQIGTPPPQDAKQRSSLKGTLPKTTIVGTKAFQRAQIQGELSSLEAQLAAVEDLQARMAAKLSSIDSNMDVPPTVAPSSTPAATTSPPVEKDTPMHPERVMKPKKNKKSRQDKALKQQENLKEAKEMKEAASVVQRVGQEDRNVMPVVEPVKTECAVDSWEDIEQVEVVWESKSEKVEVKENVTTLQQDITIKKEDIAIVEQDITNKQETIAPVEQDITIKQENIVTLEQNITIKQENVATLEQDITIRKENVATLEQDITIKKKSIATLEQDITNKQENIPLLEQDITIEQENVATLEQYITNKQEITPILEQDITIKQENLPTSEQDITNKQGNVATLEQDITIKKESLATVEQVITNKQENIAPVEQDITIRKDYIATLDHDITIKQENIPIVEQNITVKKENTATVEQDPAIKQENVATLEQDATIKQSPSCETMVEEMQHGLCEVGNVEKKIVVDCDAEEKLGVDLDKALASEIAGYLMADYNSMLNLRMALDAQCQVAILNRASVLVDEVIIPKTTKGGPYFSYADALKSSLPQTEEVCDKQTHVYQYMQTEYDKGCLAKLELEQSEIIYQEAAETKPSKSPVPQIEVSLAGTPEILDDDDDDDDDDAKPQEAPHEVNQEYAVIEALVQDYQKMNAVTTCMGAEAKCWEVICTPSASADSKSSCCSSQKKASCQGNAGDATKVAASLKDECQRMEAHRVALQSGESCHVDVASSDEARHAEAVRRATVLEAATMEVEYEGAEEQFLIQRETRRMRPWKWVRADTAPAHIDVPETVHEPLSDAEEEPDTRSTEVLTDMHGLVFQCRDTYSQTDSELIDITQLSCRLQEEVAQRMALQKYVHALEQEVNEQCQKLSDQRRITDQLEDSISDKKAEASEAKMIAAEYKSRFTDMEGGMNYQAASQAQAKIEDLEGKLQQSSAEVKSLMEKLSDRYQQIDLMPVIVHEQQMKNLEDVCHDLQVKVVQLEAQLAKLKNVRDVWGSTTTSTTNNPPTLQGGGGLDLGFSDLSPVPTCLSSLGLSESSPDGTTLTSGLLSGLSDITNKSTPVVAPLAMQEDMDSDDDIDWTSASEYLRDAWQTDLQNQKAPRSGVGKTQSKRQAENWR